MIVDLSCPIELRSYELLSDDFGNIRAYIRLNNLSKKYISGYCATISWYNAITRARITENIDVDQCEIEPMSAFKLVHSTQNVANVDHVEMYFSRVVFEDATEWKPGNGDLIEIGEQRFLTGAKLDRLREAAGEDAVQYPQIQKEYWRCVCGRINLLSDDACIRCSRDRNLVLKKYNAKAVSRMDEREHDGRGKSRKPRTKAQKKRAGKRIVYLLLAALLIAALAVIGYRFGRYGNEMWKMPEGESWNTQGHFSAYWDSNISAS